MRQMCLMMCMSLRVSVLVQMVLSSDSSWTPLLSSSKRITLLPKGTFDEAESRCSKIHGRLINFADGDEVHRVAKELYSLYPSSATDLWIGLRKKGFYSRWTNGKYFNAMSFNITRDNYLTDEANKNNLCAALFTGVQSFNVIYQLNFVDCWHSKMSVCEEIVDPYKIISITGITVAGVCFIIIVCLFIWWFFFRRHSRGHCAINSPWQ